MASTQGEQSKGKGRRRLLIGGLIAGLLAAVAFVPRAVAAKRVMAAESPNPEQARAHVGRMAEHVLDRVDATDAQRVQVDALLDQMVPDILATKAEGRALRQAFRAELVKEKLDPARLEVLRKEALALADRFSARAVADVVAVSEVLTPAQRIQLMDEMSKRRGRRHGGWRGHHE